MSLSGAEQSPVRTATGRLREAVDGLIAAAERRGDAAAALRLRDAVVLPLDRYAGQHGRPDGEPAGEPLPDGIVAIAAELTRLAIETADIHVTMAAAAAQDLAWPDASSDDRARLEQAGRGSTRAAIRVVPNGPHLLSGTATVVDHLGRSVSRPALTALCRCGNSAVKPSCDGACLREGFDDAKDPHRVADRLDEYVGVQVEVRDNRGTCQHAGLCTDRLPTVFRTAHEPFVAPSGGRMDEIVRAVRDCPSGALSVAVDGILARDLIDHGHGRPPTVEITKGGPYRVSGDIELLDADGADVPRNAGASHEHFALCRCGHAQNKPFCTGMHWYVGFDDPPQDPDATPTVFEWAGGLPAFLRLTRLFYEKYVPADPILAPLFATMSPDHPQRVATWLAEVFGGPRAYSAGYGGYARMLSEHVGKHLSEEQRARWVQLLLASAVDAGLPNDAEFRSAFGSYIEWGSRLAVENSQAESRPPANMPMPHWDWQTAAGPPTGRVSALAPPAADDDVSADLPGPDEPLVFAEHIRPLFRRRDRQSMLFAFDLWDEPAVRQHAAAILERLRNGSMPCDGTWPQQRIEVFARWAKSEPPA